MSARGIQGGAPTDEREPSPNELRFSSALHPRGRDGYCSMCNRDEGDRSGERLGVLIRVRNRGTWHWFCPECAKGIVETVQS